MTIPVTRPYFSDAEAAAVARVLESGWVSQGPKVAEFEVAFARYVGARHAVAINSCTAGLHLALLALGIGPGDEVVLPAFTFIASANAVEYCGATPVFVDIDPLTYNVDVAAVAGKLTSRTRAMMPVHLFGLSADMEPIMALARARNLHVIEDAACGVGARYRGTHVGTIGAAGCFSFHPRKAITTGEGGMLTTDDDALAAHVRSLRSHAASVSDLSRHEGSGFRLPQFAEVGFNYRMTDLQAAVGVVQMEKLDTILTRRTELADRYTAALAGIPGLRAPAVPSGYVHGYQSYVAWVGADAALSRDELAARLEADGIAVRQGTHAVHALDYYAKRYGLAPGDCPRAWEAEQRSLALPLYPTMQPSEHRYVVERLRSLLCA